MVISCTLYVWDHYGQKYIFRNFKIDKSVWTEGTRPSEFQTIHDLEIAKFILVVET